MLNRKNMILVAIVGAILAAGGYAWARSRKAKNIIAKEPEPSVTMGNAQFRQGKEIVEKPWIEVVAP